MDYIIGIGGTGGNTIRNLKYRMDLYREQSNVQYVYLDTISFDKVRKSEEESDKRTGNPLLTRNPIEFSEYIGMKGGELREELQRISRGEPGTQAYKWVKANTFLERFRVSDKVLSFEAGAGQFRQVGRLAIFMNHKDICDKINVGFGKLGANEAMNVYVVCSLVGGTGSGGFMDLAANLRDIARVREGKLHIFLFLVLEAAFRDVSGLETRHTPERAYAVLRELHRMVQSYTHRSSLTIEYPTKKARVDQGLFDGVFLVDMPAYGDLTGEALRMSGLYPAIADIVELFTEKHTGAKLDEDVVNVNSRIRRWQNKLTLEKQDEDLAAMARGDIKDISDRLPDFQLFFSTFTCARIMYPKRRYLRLTALKLAKHFIYELFQPNEETRQLRDDYLPSEQSTATGRIQVMDRVNMEVAQFLSGWNSSIGDHFELAEHHPTEWDEKKLEAFMAQGWNKPGLLLRACAPRDRLGEVRSLEQENFQDYKEMCSNNEGERHNVTNAVRKRKEDLHGPAEQTLDGDKGTIHNRLSNYASIQVEQLRDALIKLVLKSLNPQNPQERRGRLGYLIKVFDTMNNDYLNSMIGRLEARQKEIVNQWNKANGTVMHALGAINEGTEGKIFGFGATLKKTQEAYLQKEEALFKITKRGIANRYLIEILKGAKEKVEQWRKECQRWALDVVMKEDSTLDRISQDRGMIRSELRQLAQSPNLYFGVPWERGSNILEPDTSMGGYEEHLEETIDFDSRVSSWLETLSWEINNDHLNLTVFTPKEKIENGKEMLKSVLRKSENDCKDEIGERDIFDYLTKYLPNREEGAVPIVDSAKRIAESFFNSTPFLEFDSTNTLTAHYLFYKSPSDPDVDTFVDALEQELKNLTSQVGSIERIDNYEASEVLGYARLIYGIVPDACTTTQKYMKEYIDSLRNRDAMLDIYHIFPEEQNAVQYEKNVLSAAGIRINSMDQAVPYQLLPLFADMDHFNLFLDLWALEIITSAKIEELGDSSIFYLWLGDPTQESDERNLKDVRKCFHLSMNNQLFSAIFNFVNKANNCNSAAIVTQLPEFNALRSIRRGVLDSWQKNENFSNQTQEALLFGTLNTILKELKEGEFDANLMIEGHARTVEEKFKKLLIQILERRVADAKTGAEERIKQLKKKSARLRGLEEAMKLGEGS